jgi:hypothetical protein
MEKSQAAASSAGPACVRPLRFTRVAVLTA